MDTYYKALYKMQSYVRRLVKYRVGEFVQAPPWLGERGYHLTVFRDEETLYQFLNLDRVVTAPNLTLWAVECLDEISPIPPRLNNVLYPLDIYDYCEVAWPLGTLMFKQVKLVKQIDGEPYEHN